MGNLPNSYSSYNSSNHAVLRRTHGFSLVHEGTLLMRGPKDSIKDGFAMDRYCVLVISHLDNSHYIFGFKTMSHWIAFQTEFWNEFTSDTQVNWDNVQNNSFLDTIIALKHTHILKVSKPSHELESFNKNGYEIYVSTAKRANTANKANTDAKQRKTPRTLRKEFKIGTKKTLTNINDQYLILDNEKEYSEWIETIQNCVKLEKESEIRRNIKQTVEKLNNPIIKQPIAAFWIAFYLILCLFGTFFAAIIKNYNQSNNINNDDLEPVQRKLQQTEFLDSELAGFETNWHVTDWSSTFSFFQVNWDEMANIQFNDVQAVSSNTSIIIYEQSSDELDTFNKAFEYETDMNAMNTNDPDPVSIETIVPEMQISDEDSEKLDELNHKQELHTMKYNASVGFADYIKAQNELVWIGFGLFLFVCVFLIVCVATRQVKNKFNIVELGPKWERVSDGRLSSRW